MDSKPSYVVESAIVMGVALELGFIIAIPIVVLGTLGKWLDVRHHTTVWVYVGIVLALASSVTWLFQRFESMLVRLRRAAKTTKSSNTQDR